MEEKSAEIIPIGDSDFIGDYVRCEHLLPNGRRCARLTQASNSLCKFHSLTRNRFLEVESRYSDSLSGNEILQRKFKAFYDDPDICDLRPELALMRSIVASYLELAAQTTDGLLDKEVLGPLTTLLKGVSDLATQVSRMEKKGNGWISRRQTEAFVDYVIGVVSDNIQDYEILSSIQRQLEAASLPAIEQEIVASCTEVAEGIDGTGT